MYSEPCEERPCMKCKYRRYDSMLDEMWCGHAPIADGVHKRCLINCWGTCEYYEEDK